MNQQTQAAAIQAAEALEAQGEIATAQHRMIALALRIAASLGALHIPTSEIGPELEAAINHLLATGIYSRRTYHQGGWTAIETCLDRALIEAQGRRSPSLAEFKARESAKAAESASPTSK